MTKEPFEKIDRELMKKLEGLRKKELPKGLLEGFSASVEKKIREKEAHEAPAYKPARRLVPMWVPTFAVLILAVVVVLRLPKGPDGAPVTQPSQTLTRSVQAPLTDLADEITVLMELGVWTDEDESAVGNNGYEGAARDLEFALV
ncbi:MAG: hypothetical protein ACREH5_00800 [Candidatus Omnitrophota bacterium]